MTQRLIFTVGFFFFNIPLAVLRNPMSSLIFMFYVAAYIIKSILSKHEGNKMLKQRIVDFDKTLSKQDYSQLKVSFQQTQLPCSYKNKKKKQRKHKKFSWVECQNPE